MNLPKNRVNKTSDRNIVLRKLDELIPYARNPRTHSDDQIAVIAGSIREFGWTNPVLLDGRNGIIAGHGRVLAARKLGMLEVPCIELAHLTEAQRRAYVIADNQTALRSSWDDELLRLEIGDLQGIGFDLSLLGFESDALDALLAPTGTAGLTDPDEVPEPPVNPVSRTGDLWVLGRHRLLCGSATNVEDHERVLGGTQVNAVLTDPPYGVGVEYRSFDDSEEAVKRLIDGFMPLLRKWPIVMLTSGHRAMWHYPRPTWVLAWVHPAGMGNGPWGFNQFHPILVWGKDPYLKARMGGRPDSIVLAADRQSVKGHPTPKPIKLWTWLVERCTTGPNMVLFEPFSGSGTGIIAAEMTARICYAIELDPVYIDVAVERWMKFTGQVATLDGKPWADIQAERYDATKDSLDSRDECFEAVKQRVAAGGPGWLEYGPSGNAGVQAN